MPINVDDVTIRNDYPFYEQKDTNGEYISHSGTDLTAPSGTDALAHANGKVIEVVILILNRNHHIIHC